MDTPDDWFDWVRSIAVHCARKNPSGSLSWQQKLDAAQDGVIAYVAEHGWPGDKSPLYKAANNNLAHEINEAKKHIRRWVLYDETHNGNSDVLGERITDKIGVRQLIWAFPPKEWEAVWAMAQVQPWGTYRDAAKLVDSDPATFASHLYLARKRARALWIAPYETPRGGYKPGRLGHVSKMQNRRTRDKQRERAAAA